MSRESPKDFIEHYPPADRAWANDFLVALWWNELTDDQCRSELAGQLESLHDSGQRTEELFGDPWDYGKQRAQTLLTPAQRANAELTVQTSAALLTGVGMLVGLICVGFGLWIGFRDGWANHSWHYWQLAALGAGAGIAASVHLWWFYRLKGRFEVSWMAGLLGSLISIGVGVTIAVLGGEMSLPVPNWLAPILGAGAVWGAWFLLPTGNSKKPSSSPAPLDINTWFDEVARLLRGRYGMNAKETREALAPARQHCADQGADGSVVNMLEDFGAPNSFAIGLAVNTENALKRRWLGKRLLPLAVAGLYGIGIILSLLDPERSGWDIFIGVALLVFVGICLYQLRRADREEYVEDKLAERRAHAQALAEGNDE